MVLSSPQSWPRGQTEGGALSHGRLPLAKADSRGTGEGKAVDRESFHGNKPSKTSGGENDANNPRGRGHPAIAPGSSRRHRPHLLVWARPRIRQASSLSSLWSGRLPPFRASR